MKFASCHLFALLALSTQDVSSFAPTKVATTTVASSTSPMKMGDESRATDNRKDIPQSVLLDTHGTLASLFGSDHKRASFYTHQYGADKRTPDNVVHLTRDPIMDIQAPVKDFDAKSLYETNDNISLLRIGGDRTTLDRDEMSFDAFEEYIRGGGSSTIPIAEGDYMYKFRQDIEKVFDQTVPVNVYHSGPSAVAPDKNYNSFDVFVLQLVGEKTWTIQADGKGGDLSSIGSWKNVSMTPGDLLFIPRGIFHSATTADGFPTSTHITIELD